MRVLITGAAGFIGTNFLYYWLRNHPKDEIRVIDSLTYAGNIENLTPIIKKIKFFEADINDREKVAEAMKGVDIVVHFAAESHVERSIFDPGRYWQTNVKGTLTMLEEAQKQKVPRFHHISSDEVYGELALDSDDKFSEDTPYAPRPDNLYALSKAEADKLVLDFNERSDMFITISNCSNNYGPYQFPEKFVPIVMTNLIDGIRVPLHGDGRNVRDWIHTEDHASAIDLILQKGKRGEIYLIGSDNQRDNSYIAHRIVELYGKDEKAIRHVPDRHSNDRRYAIDATKIRNELGWKPKVGPDNFDDGLKETLKWYKKNQNWWRPLLERNALIMDNDRSFSAFITLDRQTGKSKFIFGEFNGKKNNPNKPEKTKDFKEKDLVRYEIVIKNLEAKRWFKNSSKKIKEKIKTLSIDPFSFGYVEDLSTREDKVGKDTIKRLVQVEKNQSKFGVYSIVSWFEIESFEKEKRVEGFFSWGWGPKSGAKLLVLVRRKKKITHLLFERTLKFPQGSIVYGLAGGFPKLNESILDLIVRSLDEDLGIVLKSNEITLSEIISLGRIMTDSGMTNNHPNLYAIVLDFSDKVYPEIKEGVVLEEEKGRVFWPTGKITEIINKVDDSYFLAAISRLSLTDLTNLKLT